MKQYWMSLLLSAAVMLLPPFFTVRFAAEAGMAICFILFFAVYPLYMIWLGIHCGSQIKNMWSVPLLAALLYLISMWLDFSEKEHAFVLYAAAYFLLSAAAMIISFLLAKKPGKKGCGT